jgi:hypothetical protein
MVFSGYFLGENTTYKMGKYHGNTKSQSGVFIK